MVLLEVLLIFFSSLAKKKKITAAEETSPGNCRQNPRKRNLVASSTWIQVAVVTSYNLLQLTTKQSSFCQGWTLRSVKQKCKYCISSKQSPGIKLVIGPLHCGTGPIHHRSSNCHQSFLYILHSGYNL